MNEVEDELNLPIQDYRRYGRQMIIDGFGLPAQKRLQESSVLVVGAGGLGCPALQYLCSAGVGRIGIVDPDVVELSNLQRQVLHSEETLKMPKVHSAHMALKRLNSRTKFDIYEKALDAASAEETLTKYDVILDCTDNAPTRYLLSDTAVRLGRPLVSGAAQKFDGQLCTYNLGLPEADQRGPCYRCIFPKPPAPEMAGSCEETGILGAVTGVIGSLQAVEAIKIITGLHDCKPSLLIYSAMSFPPFRSIKLRPRSKTCAACGDAAEKLGKISELDYVSFCGGPRPDWEKKGLETGVSGRRIRATELQGSLKEKAGCIRILDVRPPVEFGICHLHASINIPLAELLANPTSFLSNEDGVVNQQTVLVCRLGNDSQIAADALLSAAAESTRVADHNIVDLVGGLRSWSRDVDAEFPIY